MSLDGCDVASLVVVVPLGDADPVALPLSDSSGICTFNRGRTSGPPVRKLFDRDGGVKTVSVVEESEVVLVI